ncbi:flavoprotein [Streptomyces sp. NPDC002766]|uniref:flavoprotein n=1 Tax=Streptomyces sp. NPDC002766 TaxID=3154429 RepID=UPI003327B4D3
MRDDALSVIACGSSAASQLPQYLTWLRQEIDLGLRVLLTADAARFVQPQLVAWHADECYTSDDPALNPVEFAKRSAAVIVLPATANTLASAALGLAATPAQTALLAAERPVLFFPNMNRTMWIKEPVQRHVATLRADGHTVVEPQERVVFELWRRENAVGISMPAPDETASTVVAWLEKTLADEADGRDEGPTDG